MDEEKSQGKSALLSTIEKGDIEEGLTFCKETAQTVNSQVSKYFDIK